MKALEAAGTEQHDARMLATTVADPVAMNRRDLDRRIGAADNHVLSDAVAELTARTEHAASRTDKGIGNAIPCPERMWYRKPAGS